MNIIYGAGLTFCAQKRCAMFHWIKTCFEFSDMVSPVFFNII